MLLNGRPDRVHYSSGSISVDVSARASHYRSVVVSLVGPAFLLQPHSPLKWLAVAGFSHQLQETESSTESVRGGSH